MKLAEVLTADKNSPMSRLDDPHPEEAMIVRLIRQKLKDKEKITRRLSKGSEGSEPAWLTHLIAEGGGRTSLVFTTSKGRSSVVVIEPFSIDGEKWQLVKSTPKGPWIFTRAANEAMEHEDAPMIYELMKQRLRAGEHIDINVKTTWELSPSIDDTDKGRYDEVGTIEHPWMVTFQGERDGRPTVVVNYFINENDDHDSVYFYADVMDDLLELRKIKSHDEHTGKDARWVLENRTIPRSRRK